jgi:hypothetical protein
MKKAIRHPQSGANLPPGTVAVYINLVSNRHLSDIHAFGFNADHSVSVSPTSKKSIKSPLAPSVNHDNA